MTYSEKLRDPRWQKMRLMVFERDGWKCRDCRADDQTLHVHHCVYKGDPWEANPDQLLTLCDRCHSERQNVEQSCRDSIGKLSSVLSMNDMESLERVLFRSIARRRLSADDESLLVIDWRAVVARRELYGAILDIDNQEDGE